MAITYAETLVDRHRDEEEEEEQRSITEQEWKAVIDMLIEVSFITIVCNNLTLVKQKD